MKLGLAKVVKSSVKKTGNWMNAHAPEILAGTGIGCFFGAIISGIKVAPKAKNKIDNLIKQSKDEQVTLKDKIAVTWKDYLIPVSFATAGTGFIIMSVSKSNKKYVALSTSYELLRDAATKYKENVLETIGKNQEAKVRTKIAQKDVDENPPKENSIILTSNGNTLFRESLTGQYFRGDINKVKNLAVEISNQELSSPEQYVGVEDWLLALGLEIPDYMMGKGWSILDQGKAVVILTDEAVVANKYNGEPCIVIDYNMPPIDEYFLLNNY